MKRNLQQVKKLQGDDFITGYSLHSLYPFTIHSSLNSLNNAMFTTKNHSVQAPSNNLKSLKEKICQNYLCDEDELVEEILKNFPKNIDWNAVQKRTIELIDNAREDKKNQNLMDSLLSEYSLSNKEGVLLMCLAEALIRIPDKKTAKKFIHSILDAGNWQSHLEKNQSLFINASTWALMFGERISNYLIEPKQIISSLISRIGLGSMNTLIAKSITIIAKQFVLSPTINKALANGKNEIEQGYVYTFDMLGEAALCEKDALHYSQKYRDAIDYLGKNQQTKHSISIKLSALYSRYEYRQRGDVLNALYQRLEGLVLKAIDYNLPVSIDAEESERLLLSLELIEKLMKKPAIAKAKLLGVVVQAYSKRCLSVLAYLNELAQTYNSEMPIRLVKGAYWDTEIKKAQQMGLPDFPVFTRKENTDLNYLFAANYLFHPDVQKNLIPQFATHNAHTISSILQMANKSDRFEFQKLHGMGQTLYNQVLEKDKINCRIYAPIGEHKYLLPYLVRRLLENGANTSFVNRLIDKKLPAHRLATHPHEDTAQQKPYRNTNIKKPLNIFHPRKNSKGTLLQDISAQRDFESIVQKYKNHSWQAESLLGFTPQTKSKVSFKKALNPANLDHEVGQLQLLQANEKLVDEIYQSAKKAFIGGQIQTIESRATNLLKLAGLLEKNRQELIALCIFETGKVYQDAVDEIREAVDFCRYYASCGLEKMQDERLPGPSGENNTISYSGKGVFLCISPWNFPLAIFIGQISACYMAGNSVIAKTSPLSPLIAHKAMQLMYEAGMQKSCLQLIVCEDEMNSQLTSHHSLNGVLFTGSTQTAQKIQANLVARKNTPIATLVAETGGLNAMIVDSTALAEQVVLDMMTSAFQSAGQRCSALRIALIQESIYDEVIGLLKGAMQMLRVNQPDIFSTDVGPVIDKVAYKKIKTYLTEVKKKFPIFSAKVDKNQNGFFIEPTLVEVNDFSDVKEEVFAPILHTVPYKNDALERTIEKINQSGFGLTLGIHSRNQQTQAKIIALANVGNIYINRNQIGAIVGSQPFGGRGFSGTGPKAGGDLYLMRLVDEKVISNNIAAIGGNPDLLAGFDQNFN